MEGDGTGHDRGGGGGRPAWLERVQGEEMKMMLKASESATRVYGDDFFGRRAALAKAGMAADPNQRLTNIKGTDRMEYASGFTDRPLASTMPAVRPAKAQNVFVPAPHEKPKLTYGPHRPKVSTKRLLPKGLDDLAKDFQHPLATISGVVLRNANEASREAPAQHYDRERHGTTGDAPPTGGNLFQWKKQKENMETKYREMGMPEMLDQLPPPLRPSSIMKRYTGFQVKSDPPDRPYSPRAKDAWKEMQEQGIDPYEDQTHLLLGNTAQIDPAARSQGLVPAVSASGGGGGSLPSNALVTAGSAALASPTRGSKRASFNPGLLSRAGDKTAAGMELAKPASTNVTQVQDMAAARMNVPTFRDDARQASKEEQLVPVGLPGTLRQDAAGTGKLLKDQPKLRLGVSEGNRMGMCEMGLTSLARKGPGMIHGVLVAPFSVMREVTAQAKTWGRINSIMYEQDKAVYDVNVDPKYFSAFLVAVQEAGEGQVSFESETNPPLFVADFAGPGSKRQGKVYTAHKKRVDEQRRASLRPMRAPPSAPASAAAAVAAAGPPSDGGARSRAGSATSAKSTPSKPRIADDPDAAKPARRRAPELTALQVSDDEMKKFRLRKRAKLAQKAIDWKASDLAGRDKAEELHMLGEKGWFVHHQDGGDYGGGARDSDPEMVATFYIRKMAELRKRKEEASAAATADGKFTVMVYPDINHADEDGNTPLLQAARRGFIKAVDRLLKMGANPRHKNLRGKNALMLAKAESQLASLAVSARAPGAAERKRRAAKLVQLLDDRTIFRVAQEGDLRRLIYMVDEENVNVNMTNNYGMTPLHFAVMRKDPDMTKFLKARGADEHQRNNNGQTPASIIRGYGEAFAGRALQQALKEGHILRDEAVRNATRAGREERARALAARKMTRELRAATRGTTAAKAVFATFPDEGPLRKGDVERAAEDMAEMERQRAAQPPPTFRQLYAHIEGKTERRVRREIEEEERTGNKPPRRDPKKTQIGRHAGRPHLPGSLSAQGNVLDQRRNIVQANAAAHSMTIPPRAPTLMETAAAMRRGSVVDVAAMQLEQRLKEEGAFGPSDPMTQSGMLQIQAPPPGAEDPTGGRGRFMSTKRTRIGFGETIGSSRTGALELATSWNRHALKYYHQQAKQTEAKAKRLRVRKMRQELAEKKKARNEMVQAVVQAATGSDRQPLVLSGLAGSRSTIEGSLGDVSATMATLKDRGLPGGSQLAESRNAAAAVAAAAVSDPSAYTQRLMQERQVPDVADPKFESWYRARFGGVARRLSGQ